jgi:CHAT domain-containing protein
VFLADVRPAAAQAADPASQLAAARARLDLCIDARDDACTVRHVAPYLDAARAAPAPNAVLRAELVREAAYYIDAGKLALGRSELTAQILSGDSWRNENAANGELYLRRQLLAVRVQLALGRPAEAAATLDKALSLIASLRNPEARPAFVAQATAEAIGGLIAVGQVERAWGLYRAAGPAVVAALPPASPRALDFRLAEARLLQATGDFAGSLAPLDAALPALRGRSGDARLAEALSLQALGCVGAGQPDCPDPQLPRLEDLPTTRDGATVLRVRQALAETGIDPKAAFALFQLAGRAAPTFDADALTHLSLARDEAHRRSLHQALRLRARRDRLERKHIQAVLARAAAEKAPGAYLSHDPAVRLRLRDFARRLDRAQSAEPRAGLVELRAFQRVLHADETALAVAPTPDGLAYLCVRRDSARVHAARVDKVRLKIDGRLVQAALTAGHAPSERLDAQYPVEAAIRLNAALIAPFAGCLKAGDRIVWLPGTAGLDAPLAALLPAPPPKLAGGGYDLSQADWLVRRHAIAYAGSASLILATRSAGPRPAADFDFLGVGDPVLEGEAAAAVTRGARGLRVSGLAPLPETRDELEASAKAFGAARLLLRDAATERSLRGEMVGAYRYLSFATHGLMREDLQGLNEPALVLTPVDADDPANDGLLTASEIADLNLRAAFVALSACNTANFDVTQMAQDLPALSSAFAVAGVPATLGTLWPVDSETGKRVVAALFADIGHAGVAPADALAAAQRAFLAAPPGRAWLHPRFWAPFVLLGDGGPGPAAKPPAALAVKSVEVLTKAGGEVIALTPAGGGVAARLISDADANGRHAGAVSVSGGQSWRQESPGVGAMRFLAQLGPTLVAGGQSLSAHGRYAPVLETFGPNGARGPVWTGHDLSKVDAFLLAGVPTSPDSAVIAVAELNLRDASGAGGGRLHVLSVDAALQPRLLFTAQAPAGGRLSAATLTPLGADLLVTYTDETAATPAAPGPAVLDDWQASDCVTEPVTWIELRDGRTGALKAAREIRGLSLAAAALKGPDAWLGGALKACGEDRRAVVLAANARLETRQVYVDDSLGASDVRALVVLPDGRAAAAAGKQNVVDYPPNGALPPKANPYAVLPFHDTVSGMVVLLGRNGKAAPPRMLDSGSNVYVTALQTGSTGEILVGGAVGGQAALIRLEPAGGARP